MLHLKRALLWLRPALTGSQVWDYCVVWKLSDSEIPRSIEWVDCYCAGGSDGESCINSPGLGDPGLSSSIMLCRDTFNPHPASKKSCHALTHFPSFMDLSSGLYEEVLVSGQPRWINFADKFAFAALHEAIGTRVLIPVVGGLVELFSKEQIMESQTIMEFIAAQFDMFSQPNTISSLNHKDATFVEDGDLNNWSHEFVCSGKISNSLRLEGSSCSSIPSCLGSVCPSENTSPDKQLLFYSSLENVKQNQEFLLSCEKGKEQMSCEENEQQYKSKNLIAERNRRARIKRAMCDLRALVPKITKMSQAATLEDSIDYIEEMEMKAKALQEELMELERDEVIRATRKPNAGEHEQGCSLVTSLSQVQVEVYQLTLRDFVIKILCEAKAGAFSRLLEALSSLGLQIKDVTSASCKGMVSSSFTVQAVNGETEVGKLRDALICNLVQEFFVLCNFQKDVNRLNTWLAEILA